ncbi:hypothetical protein B0A55_00314 [Friedmanniomyces simplex]|uniref:Uncharacterized protein n=1 Tax=Friedmanniomyces simplex TaxID=329884 RepID=A0A4U0Y3F6_9PEZI|nr:hypothetical protein B0A55_00314 [Friedmanniomyces simplex]
MFGMPGSSLAYRNRKDLARSQQLRGLTRRRTAGPSIEDVYVPAAANPWQRNMYGYTSPLSSRFEELGDEPLPRSSAFNSSSTPDYGPPFATQDSKRRAADYSREPLPFAQAAETLCQALEYATKHCRGIREHFEKEVASISLWASPKAIEALWGMKAEWDGVDQGVREKTAYQQPQPAGDVVTYKSVVERLLAALGGMKRCDQPCVVDRMMEGEGGKAGPPAELSPEVFRYTMKKLEVTLRGIEELMGSVRKDRRLVEPLVKDLGSAAALLREVEEVWVLPRRRSAAGKYRARAESDEEDYVRGW